MNSSKRVMFNSIVLYIKIIITMLISLVSVPMILHALGKSDYGLYNLVAGIIAMLAFLNSSMAITTQRYLSVAIGEKNLDKLNNIYNVALILHLGIGLIIVALFEICALFLFDGTLNIEPERIQAAKIIYQFIVVSTFFTIISVPYTAVMNAKENMLTFSIIAIIDSLLKLGLAFYLGRCPFDRLIVYGGGVALISFLSMFFYRIYVKVKYKEFKVNFMTYYSKESLIQMLGFTGWNTLGAVAMIGRNQGIAIIFNLFCGTIANAAYGIANQINGVLGYFSTTFQKALNPQLMQSEGMHNRTRLIRISMISSKYSVWVIALFAIPLIMEMPYVLKIWLKDVPEYTLRLSQLILVLSIVYQYSVGLMSSIQAVGRIRNYFIVMSVLILLNLPICYFLLKLGSPLYYCLIVFIVLEFISLIVRLLMANKLVGIKVVDFVKSVVFPTSLSMIISLVISLPCHLLMKESFFRLITVCLIYLIVYIVIAWFFVFDKEVKQSVLAVTNRFLHRTNNTKNY